jgi:DNA invertase Pin-like site-specific DNA recombinase
MRDPTRDLSPVAQEAAVRELAGRQGEADSLVVLSDLDLSGRLGRDKRPGYNRLLTAIESGECTALYSYSLSRLGRSVAELARLVGDCVDRGIPVRLYADALDTATASGTLLFHVLASVAQFEAQVASERVKAANAAKLARGEKVGTAKFYGEAEGEDADLVLAAFHEAGGYSGAARLLNERGVKPKSSKKGVWWPSSVAVVVKRLEPQAGRLSSRGVRAHSHFRLARLLRCPTCDTRLTGTRDRVDGPNKGRVRYACRLGTVTPHARVSISEHLILPAIKAEVARATAALISFERPVGDEIATSRTALEEDLRRLGVAYRARALSDAEFDGETVRIQRALSDLDEDPADGLDDWRYLGPDLRGVVTNPTLGPLVDWEAEPAEVNRRLRAVFREIRLDPVTMQPVALMWRRPEWRSAD